MNGAPIEDIVSKDPMTTKWISQISAYQTKANYLGALRIYCEFTKLPPSELIKEAYEDSLKNPMDRQDIAARRLLEFHKWLKTDAPVRNNSRQIIGKGFTDGGAGIKARAIHSFYTKILKINLGLSGRLDDGRVTNKRIYLTADQVRSLVENARTIRDRALIVFAYQSLMDSDTITKLKAGEVLPHLDKEPPIKIETYREKAHVNYVTFIGSDTVRYLKAYIAELKNKGIVLKDSDPLFITERKQDNKIVGIETTAMQAAIKSAATKAGLIKEEAKWNSAGFHALREGASRILMHNAGVDKFYVDLFLGHKLSGVDQAYFAGNEDKLKEEYKKGMALLAVTSPLVSNGELTKKVELAVNAQTVLLSKQVTQLSEELERQKKEYDKKMETQKKEFNEQLEKLENKVAMALKLIKSEAGYMPN
jgi:integrase/recombinase XerD